jgi:hypothetical protein
MDAAEMLRKAMIARGLDPDDVEAAAASPTVIPPDEDEAQRQAWYAERRHDRLHGTACVVCSDDVRADDAHALVEVTGWTPRPIPPVDPVPTYRVERTERAICGKCAETITGPKQEALL